MATVPIRPLAWETPRTAYVALKRQKDKKTNKNYSLGKEIKKKTKGELKRSPSILIFTVLQEAIITFPAAI